jgi:hypothetical protein
MLRSISIWCGVLLAARSLARSSFSRRHRRQAYAANGHAGLVTHAQAQKGPAGGHPAHTHRGHAIHSVDGPLNSLKGVHPACWSVSDYWAHGRATPTGDVPRPASDSSLRPPMPAATHARAIRAVRDDPTRLCHPRSSPKGGRRGRFHARAGGRCSDHPRGEAASCASDPASCGDAVPGGMVGAPGYPAQAGGIVLAEPILGRGYVLLYFWGYATASLPADDF